jgi:PPM family protein phosphatase
MVKLISAAATDIGLLRSNNEDAYLVMPEAGLFAISDGMGGAAAGEIASRYFIETAQAVFRSRAPSFSETNHELARKVFRRSNERIFEHTEQYPDDEGMGCTGDLLVFDGDRYVVGHAGDSRIYLLRDGILRQLTKDHSFVQRLVDNGTLTPEEAKHHPRKNIILQALGIDPSVSFDIMEGAGLNHDIFLLCTDGLTDMVADSAIQDILVSSVSIQHKVKELIAAAIAAGGRDNVTVILCEVNIEDSADLPVRKTAITPIDDAGM